MSGAQAAMLPDGRLHLQHGPIDLILGADGPGRTAALALAARRFESVLDELVAELPRLRRPDGPAPRGPVARRMAAAVAPFDVFVTPMAAVAGAVADEILAVLHDGPGLTRAYVNNGGDVALWLKPGETMRAAIAGPAGGRVTLRAADGIGGVATSGWRGRSHSLGIADSVTALAESAAQADAAATLIANAVDLPGHPAITRLPACALSPDSDLGERLVTRDVGRLTEAEIADALAQGADFAEAAHSRGLVRAALLALGPMQRITGTLPVATDPAPVPA